MERYPQLSYVIALKESQDRNTSSSATGYILAELSKKGIIMTENGIPYCRVLSGTTCRDTFMYSLRTDLERLSINFLDAMCNIETTVSIRIAVAYKKWYRHILNSWLGNRVGVYGNNSETIITFPSLIENFGCTPIEYPKLHYILLYLSVNTDSYSDLAKPSMNSIVSKFNRFVLNHPEIFERERNKDTIALFTAFYGYWVDNMNNCAKISDHITGAARAGEIAALQFPIDFINFVKDTGVELKNYPFYGMLNPFSAGEASPFDSPITTYEIFGSLLNKGIKENW